MTIRLKIKEFSISDDFLFHEYSLIYRIESFPFRSSVCLDCLTPISGKPSMIKTTIRGLREEIENGSVVRKEYDR